VKVLGFGLAAVLLAVSCGGGSGSGSGGDIGGINVTVTSPTGPAAVDSGLVVPITVTVTGDSGNAGVIWSVGVRHKGDPVGTLSDIKPDSVTYNAPPPDQVKAPVQVTVTATSVTDPTRAATIPISVYPAVAIVPLPNGLATAFPNTDYTCIQLPITQAGVTQIPCQVTVAGGLGPYTWTLDGGTALPDGLFLGRGLTANDVAIVGKPTLSGIYPFTLRVTDALSGTNTVALNINVAPNQLKVVTPTILTTKVGAPYTPVQLQVSGGVPPYRWALAPGSGPLPPGMTLSPSGAIAGTPTTGDSFSFAVRVVDSQSPVPGEATFPSPAPANGKVITLTASSQEPECFQGGSGVAPETPYAFVFTGFDADGPVTLSGSFTADSHGTITGGVEDIIRTSGSQLAQPLTAGGSVVFDNSGRGCMMLNTASSSAQFRLAPITKDTVTAFYHDARMTEFDDTDGSGTRGSGFFRIQDSSAFSGLLTGSYVFRFSGWNNTGGHFAMAGQAVADTGLFTSIAADVNDAGAVSGPLSGGSGTFSAVDTNGRGTVSIAIGAGVYDLIYYLVDAKHAVFSSPHSASAGHPNITGEATSSNSGPFTQASLSNSHIYRLGGSVTATADLNIGVTHFDGVSSLSGIAFTRSGGPGVTTNLAGQYAIDSHTGRFTFSGTAIPAVGYLALGAGGPTGYLVGTGASGGSGVMEFQTDSYSPGYQFSPINGLYGFTVDEALDRQTAPFVGLNFAQPNGSLDLGNSYLDTSSLSDGLLPFQSYEMFLYTFTTDGSGTYGGNTYMVTNGNKVFYLDVSPLNSHPAVVVGELQSPPAISNFTPTCGPAGTKVVITGGNLLQTIGVAFNGVEATSFRVNTNIKVTATVPAEATTGPITVETPIGVATSSSSFTVQPAQCN